MPALVSFLAIVALFAGPVGAQPTTRVAEAYAAAQAKPTQAEKRCQASRRRVERHQQAIVDADARTARERSARESCKTRRVCDGLDRALKAAEARKQRHHKQLAQLVTEAERACSRPPS